MNTLVIMAKHPVAGMVKTRLAASLGEAAAAGLAAAFLEDLLDRLHPCADRHVLATWPDNTAATTYFEELSADRFELWNQPEGSLGERLARVTTEHLGPDPHQRVVVIGSDSPTLPATTIRAAFETLKHTQVVLAPADDGGYVLIGLSCPVPSLFEGIDWSTPRVLQQTRQQLTASNTPFVELPGWYDIDTLDDLIRLDNELDHQTPEAHGGAGGRAGGGAGGATRRQLDSLPTGWDTRSQGP
jgi:rSAM/selenodomain-associated transferase 1